MQALQGAGGSAYYGNHAGAGGVGRIRIDSFNFVSEAEHAIPEQFVSSEVNGIVLSHYYNNSSENDGYEIFASIYFGEEIVPDYANIN